MHLGQALNYFTTDYLAGWDGTKWVENIVCGSLLTYDRFISARTFGEKKRLFLTGSDVGGMDLYPVVRTATGTVYILTSKNVDIECPVGDYANTYAMTQADYTAEILELTTTPAASGTHRATTRTVTATHFCDLERFSSRAAGADVPDVVYSQVRLTLPGDAVVTTDNEIRVNNTLYDIKEVEKVMRSVGCFAYKRSGDNT